MSQLETRQLQTNKSLQIQETEVESFNLRRSSFLREKAELDQKVQKLTLEKSAIQKSVPITSLATYERLRSEKKGLAIVEVIDDYCNGCGSTLTRSQLQIVRSQDAMFHCPTCGRILFND
jgi:hypothetical protein